MITVVDYGAGNLRSVQNTLEELGAGYQVTDRADEAQRADKIVLPGVGHFGQMMDALDRLELRVVLTEKIRAGTPFLGICVGLQCLFERSEEALDSAGLGVLAGCVKRFRGPLKVPHMGWDSLEATRPSKLLVGLPAGVFTYFAHSFYAPLAPCTAATCTYAERYTAVVEQENLFAVQFHPEKSGPAGLQVLRNFINLR